MAVVEARAALEMITIATKTVLQIRTNFKEISKEIKDFPRKVKLFEDKKAMWEQILEKHPLQQNDTLFENLDNAVKALVKAQEDFQRLKKANLGSKLWKKTWSSERWTNLLKDVDAAFSEIVEYLEDEHKIESLVERKSNQIKVPFCFSGDKKYVPIETTVEKVRKVLDEGDVKKVVLLYGRSGAGKTTLAKYLALDYNQKSKGALSSSNAGKFFEEVVYISCGKKADSFSLLQKLALDLGYILEHVFEKDKRSSFERLKRTLISKLRMRKPILIILDDVREQQLVADLMIQAENIKYLITSLEKKIYSDIVVEYVPMGSPSIGEACQVLTNHILDWGDKPFPEQVQEEVHGLIQEVDNDPLVLANLASLMTRDKVPDLRTWKQLRKELKTAIERVDESNKIATPMAFGEPYGGSLIASLTMAIDLISERPRSLLFLLTICSSDGVDENVLRLWFNFIHGSSMINYNHAYEDLVGRSLISVNETRKTHTRILCSVHDLRRTLIYEKNEAAVNAIVQKLIKRERSMTCKIGEVSSDPAEEDLMAALVFLYGKKEYKDEARKRIQIHKEFPRYPQWVTDGILINLAQMLPRYVDEDWEKKTHRLARTVILHFLQFLELKVQALSDLLRIPENEIVIHHLLHILELKVQALIAGIFLIGTGHSPLAADPRVGSSSTLRLNKNTL